MSKYTTTVLLSELKALTTFASLDESRHILMGVCCEIQKDKTLLIATDGRRLAVIRSLGDGAGNTCDPVSFVIPSKLLARMVKPRRKSKLGENDIEIDYDSAAERVSMRHIAQDYTLSGKIIEGSFPSWRQCIPEKKPEGQNGHTVWSFRASYLGDLARVGAVMGLRSPNDISCRQSEALGPIEIRFCEADNFYAIVMPVKQDKQPEQFQWLFKADSCPACKESSGPG